MTMTAAQDVHPNVLEDILGRVLLSLQREATELLDRSLELADRIWELEAEHLSLHDSCGWSTSLTPITEQDDDDLLEELPHDGTERNDTGDDNGNDDDVYYQLEDLRAEAAELSKRSGEAWSLFCEEVVARLSPSSPVGEMAQWRSRKQKQHQRRHQQLGPLTLAGNEEAEAPMPTLHTEEAPPHHYEDDGDAHLAELDWHSSASPRNDYDDREENGSYGNGAEEEDDHEFRQKIRQEYLMLAEQHLASQAYENKPTETGVAGADGDSDSKQAAEADMEELPGLFENLMEGKEDGDYDDSGYDEDEVEVEDIASCQKDDSGFMGDDDMDSDNESFKSCLDEFDEDSDGNDDDEMD
ncbi:hypothetical protein PG994_005028 [Apiospora phragmitis]|uniref:Uncharacterized protein n=1 Tax=Apiospora phragmitis TaxID=2905665 RepID=A0ABR1VS91_9PEZI